MHTFIIIIPPLLQVIQPSVRVFSVFGKVHDSSYLRIIILLPSVSVTVSFVYHDI